jgi:hypothetical protein
MARSEGATEASGEGPFAVILELPRELRISLKERDPEVDIIKIRDNFLKGIRRYISRGVSIIVKGWCPKEEAGFSVEDIGLVRPTMEQEVYWHGKCILNATCLTG